MALATFTIDPAAEALTPDEVVAKVNAASTDITRAGSVDPTARPIEANEITSAEIAPGAVTAADMAAAAARDNLMAMADIDRRVVVSRPVAASGDFKLISFKRTGAGLLEAEYDDVPV